MKIIKKIHTMSLIYLFCSSLFAQINIKSVKLIQIPEKGFINNPVWSIDSKQIAFDFLGFKEQTNIMIYRIGANYASKRILKTNVNSNSIIQKSTEISSLLPKWSDKENSTLYFLYDQYKPRYIGKLKNINDEKLPISVSSIESLYNSIDQHSKISEYHTVNLKDEEFLFLLQQNSTDMIHYTDQYSELAELPKLNMWIKTGEVVSSFLFSNNTQKMIICKGQEDSYSFILGNFQIEDGSLESIDYTEISIPNSEDGILDEPSFNPVNSKKIAYLKMIRNRNGGHDYHLYIYTLGTNNNNFLIDNLYLNEDNKGTRPNSTSYVWHPGGDYIFYITTDAKRNVAYIDLKNLKHPKVKILETGIEFAEQISISPNGKYLAVMTQIASEEDKGALGQLYLVELSY
tara:strand:+ start:24779 stop:25984 length:1206 start_codon:yes stop_codon:yes gene_type:complete